MSEYIPLEIQAEILKRLPLKPLIQFRSVSKTWKCLIDSPDFIVSYSAGHSQPDDRFILRYALPYYPQEERYITLIDNDDLGFVRQELIPTVPDLIKGYEYRVGNSDGLLCLRKYCQPALGHPARIEALLLWNPSIRKSISIQVPYMCGFPYFADVTVDDEEFGFGVCPVTFDPTILKIECFVDKMTDMPNPSFPWKVQVFTLSTGSWSILSTNLPRESIRLHWPQVVIDRFIYWVAYNKLDAGRGPSQGPHSEDFLIVSFDLTAKEFKEINLPDSLTNRCCWIHSISKLRESLVLLARHGEFEDDVRGGCCLWMMKDQGVNRSFTKLYNINLPYTKIDQILGFRKTGELIMEMRFESNAEVVIYNPNSEAIDNLGIRGAEYRFIMFSYLETLLLLDQ